MSDPTPLDDLNVLAERALAAQAPFQLHQDTIARAKRLVAVLQPPMPADAPARDSHGADLKP